MNHGTARIHSMHIETPVAAPERLVASAHSTQFPLFGHPHKVKLIDPPTRA